MASFGAWNITNPFIICVHMLLNMNFHYDIEHQFAQIFVQCFSFLDVNEKGIFFLQNMYQASISSMHLSLSFGLVQKIE